MKVADYQEPPSPPPEPPPAEPPPESDELLEESYDIALVAELIVEFINVPKVATSKVSEPSYQVGAPSNQKRKRPVINES